MKLVIISHTEHYKKDDGTIVGWGSTINEINQLINIFDEIVHIAVLYEIEAPESALAYTSPKIKFIPMLPLGGKTIRSKMRTLLNAPKVISIVKKELKSVDIFQLRTPTGIGVFLIPYLTLFSKVRGWYKYAGNWNQENPPLGYGLQRQMLKSQNRLVTINGKWENQPKQCITFENPCLNEKDRVVGNQIVLEKEIEGKMDYCFVGGLNENKGIEKIVDAFIDCESNKVGTLHIVGDGVLKNLIKEKTKRLAFKVIIYGSLPKDKVVEIYKKSHFILLPSKSEGFPKVIGEAMNYGCVPIVSDVSCLSQYVIEGVNGFLINPVTTHEVKNAISRSLIIDNKIFKCCILKNFKIADKFTYKYYLEQIENNILIDTF